MKIILGINCYHADSSACIIKDGQIIAAIEEERINRVKHWAGFPQYSIIECLKISNLRAEDITDIAINTNPKSNLYGKVIFFLKEYLFSQKILEIFFRYKNKIIVKNLLYKKFSFSKNLKFHYVDHHISHIASAFYPSKYEKAIGLTIDGSGDFSTLTISECSKNNIKIIKKILFPNSLGIFYEAMTQFLGFKNYGDEYKIMGLAPYGKPIFQEKIEKNIIIHDKKDFFKLNLNFFNHTNKKFEYKFNGKPNQNQIYNNKILSLFEDEDINDINFKKNFASSVQKVYEKLFSKIINFIKKNNFSKNLIFAGGCALNSSANKFLIYENNFENLYIPFSPGDGGGAIGAGMYINNKYQIDLKNNFTPYLGNSYTDNEVLEVIRSIKNEIDFEKFNSQNELINCAVEMLMDQKVIGWFQGKMEFGPRALGNRSILADPRDIKMKDKINLKIKKRENFRPFAPSILEEEKELWYMKNNFKNFYMSSVEVVKNEKMSFLGAVTHVDNSGRVQDVSKELNPLYYELIYQFFLKTKVPVLLNTSFNENEPIVRSPKEAIECLMRTDLDALFINNFKIIKKK
tara:strand:- start:63703 stop:65424 length:1722 start_codon:yes stop_codon:yes gene_type:complete